VVIEMPKPFVIPAKTEVDYQYIILKLGFAADRWIQMAEIRPGDRSVVHHAVLYVREPGSDWLRDVPPGVVYAPPHGDRAAKRKAAGTIADILAIYTPGSRPAMFPAGMGKKIPAGSDLVLQIHYTARDKTIQDVTSIGLVMCADQPKKRVLTLQMGNDTFVIPPGERNYRVAVSGTMPRDAMLLSLFPHMHLRGSAFEYQIVRDGGRVETLLRVKPYDFFWQLSYELQTPRLLRAGTRLLWVGYFDNSADNPKNPDPTAEVSWGEQSREEMMIGFFDIAVPADIDKQTFFVRQ
jgi:copper type II ascorbate-dependent monooxygenase-like protein